MATPFKPHFDPSRVAQMHQLLKLSTLPENGVEAVDDSSSDLGIKLDFLKDAKAGLEAFDIEALERKLNEFNHFTVPIEDATIHFVHEKSTRKDAVPLLILHGWPGLFYDFRKIIKELANPTDESQPAFHVVAPSIPGFAWSTLPRKKDFTIIDIARIFNSLMTQVLGYQHYLGQGGDWGSHIMRYIGANHYENMTLAHFNVFLCYPARGLASYSPWLNHMPIPQRTVDWISSSVREWGVSEAELHTLRRFDDFMKTGGGYIAIQNTRPATIGYAVAASPLALLAYIGEKKLAWTDPRCFEMDDLLSTVAIYYLTSTFQTSVMIYQQSLLTVRLFLHPREVNSMKTPMAFGRFPFDTESPPASWIAQWASLLQHHEHERGGHFPAVENPEALLDDLRMLVSNHWKQTS